MSQQRLRHRIYPHLSLARPAAKFVQPAPPGLPGPQSFLFCVVRCCSWYSLESSQGRGPRMFFHSSKLNSFIFYRVGEKNTRNKGLNSGSHTNSPQIKQFSKVCRIFQLWKSKPLCQSQFWVLFSVYLMYFEMPRCRRFWPSAVWRRWKEAKIKLPECFFRAACRRVKQLHSAFKCLSAYCLNIN